MIRPSGALGKCNWFVSLDIAHIYLYVNVALQIHQFHLQMDGHILHYCFEWICEYPVVKKTFTLHTVC